MACCRGGYEEIDDQGARIFRSQKLLPPTLRPALSSLSIPHKSGSKFSRVLLFASSRHGFPRRYFLRWVCGLDDPIGNVILRGDPDALCGPSEEKRNLVAYFILGLMNNFAYVVFLSAAADILPKDWPVSVMILVEMIPIIAAQGVAPLFIDHVPYFARVWFLTLTSFGSFYIVAFFENIYIKLVGVAIASISSGFGEITWMALSSYYHKNTVSMYSSGTGGAGIAGSLSYLLLHSVLKLSPRDSLLVVAPFALMLGISYFFILSRSRKPTWRGYRLCFGGRFLYQDDEIDVVAPTSALLSNKAIDTINENKAQGELTVLEKLKLQIRLFKYTMPLFLVYFAEYLINQGVNPVNLFPQDSFFSGSEYTYYFFLYQSGVFVSRSSVNLLRVKKLWILAVGQCGLLLFFSFLAVYNFLPTIWYMFPIIFVEGLFGGAIYANTFYLASEEIEESLREFCMSSISFWYSCGILSAGLIGIPLQDLLHDNRKYPYGAPPTLTPSSSPALSPASPVPLAASPVVNSPSAVVSSPVSSPSSTVLRRR